MRILHSRFPKEKKAEIISAYLTGDNSYEELSDYYKVGAATIRNWVCRYRKRKNVVSLQAESKPVEDMARKKKEAEKSPEVALLLNGQHGLTITAACELLGRSRQAFYKKKTDDAEKLAREIHILDAVQEIRGFDPGIGGVKLWKMLCVMFNTGWMPGRDAFLNLLRRHHLMQKPRRSRSTTNSNHRYHKWKNLIKGFKPMAANQLWQSDITYIDLAGGCCYLHLVTDAYSKKIVGWCLAESLAAVFTLKALRMAIEQAGGGDLSGLIHHSDRGIQYCCDLYVEELQKYGIQISMTEDYKPTDNALAERVNGIIKDESVYRQDRRFETYEEALEQIERFILFYNSKRPHYSIGLQTPNDAHEQTGEQKKMWKTKIYQKNDQSLQINP